MIGPLSAGFFDDCWLVTVPSNATSVHTFLPSALLMLSHHDAGSDQGVCHSVGMVRVFRQKFTLEDAIGSHACSLEANTRVTNGIPLGCSLLLPVGTVNCVQTLKAKTRSRHGMIVHSF
jgi:hypothetical protein